MFIVCKYRLKRISEYMRGTNVTNFENIILFILCINQNLKNGIYGRVKELRKIDFPVLIFTTTGFLNYNNYVRQIGRGRSIDDVYSLHNLS